MLNHGDSFPECPDCDGVGVLCLHRTGALALYPGGRFKGMDKDLACRLF